jgi:predicted alpha/beta-fold hydrolase
LPGLCGSVKGTGHTTHAMLAAGVRPVCLHARGCGVPLSTPRFNIFGSTDDVRAALARIAERHPDAPLCLYGISAGTALMVRYLGEEGGQTPVVAGVANSPGYDIGTCMQRVSWLYDSAFYIGVLKRHWLGGRNGEVLRAAAPDLCARLESVENMHSFMVAASPFASASVAHGAPRDAGVIANAFAEYLATSNPMGVAHKIQVPTLIINSDDDPICPSSNIDDNAPALLARPSGASCPRTMMLRYPRGGHCCFAAGMQARRFGDAVAAGYLAELASSRTSSR